MELGQILGYVGAFLTAIVGTYLANSVRRKNEADAAESLTSAAMKLVAEKSDDLSETKKELALVRVYSEYLRAGAEILRQQLIREHIIPLFEPKSIDDYQK